ncbi:hypothetical protein CAS74_004479 [Pichia kudriavzevii]|uniref:6-phosphofructo-2-kinase domain-containing protein n=1 Tax=Pichia kudriavzevii TaxID=4909 RepID=A0A1Z8JIH1_PICKU|nr:hypothetical protein CAS74_004479 [Pichia kudriavzevii]
MSDIANIEEAKIPGNYSARKIQRWNPSSIYARTIDNDSSANLQALRSRTANKDDAIHSNLPADHVSLAQMYSTDSGKMFHAGSICIIMVGLPGTGKTNMSISLCRYLRWLGVRAKLFHLGDYRRKNTDLNKDNDLSFEKLAERYYFSPNPDDLKIKNELISDMMKFFEESNGQIAIYDAINGISKDRVNLYNYFKARNVRCLFIESIVDDEKLLENNIKDAINSPDYKSWNNQDAINHFQLRRKLSLESYETLDTKKLIYHLFKHTILLSFKADPPITESAKDYIYKVFNTLKSQFPENEISKSLSVWTSTRLRTMQSSEIFKDCGCVVKHRPELTQLNPGAAEGLTREEIKKKFPEEYEKHKADPYHHRYPRAESYHDLALKIEPLILELEKLSHDVLIIADETIIRIFYGYLMASNANEIPSIKFPQNEIIKITYHTYSNELEQLVVEGIDAE